MARISSDKHRDETIIDWKCAVPFKAKLISNGWFSPDTYGNCFKPFDDIPAVYLFLLHESRTFEKAFVAYVGMSTRLEQRMSGHNIIPLIDIPGYWTMRWFKPTQKTNLRNLEKNLIGIYNPPWNIQGRARGVTLQ